MNTDPRPDRKAWCRTGWRRGWVSAVLIVGLTAPGLLLAQDRRDLPRVGVLWVFDPPTAAPYVQPFKEGLRDLGWIDGRTIHIIERYDNFDATRHRQLATELVNLRVDVLYVTASAVPAARNATKAIPIVCPDSYDPILEGFTSSMARPDRNVTGVSWQSVDSAIKRVQLTRELIPRVQRVGVMFDTNDPGPLIEVRGVVSAAREARISIEQIDLRAPHDIEPALAKLKDARLDALILSASALTWPVVDRIVQVASADRIPVISEPEDFAKAGAIITYGPDTSALYRRGAYFVDRILKGAAPKDLPIEQPTQFELVVNLKTAKMLGFTIPNSIMERATKVIR